jgi:hypothetical protein
MKGHSSRKVAAAALSLILAAGVSPGGDQTPSGSAAQQGARHGVDPAAATMLRRMTDYLAGLKAFKVQSVSVDEVVLKTGQKIQISNDSQVTVERPNKLRSEQLGNRGGLGYWYDGATMTLLCGANRTYATVSAPPTLDAAIDDARKQYGIEAPGADLLYSKPYDILMEQVTGGQVIGHETVGEVGATHLAFVGEQVDWQIWIQDGPRPLPVRFVITTKTLKEQPEFTVELSHWEPLPRVAASTFEFHAPAGSTRADALPTQCGKS